MQTIQMYVTRQFTYIYSKHIYNKQTFCRSTMGSFLNGSPSLTFKRSQHCGQLNATVCHNMYRNFEVMFSRYFYNILNKLFTAFKQHSCVEN